METTKGIRALELAEIEHVGGGSLGGDVFLGAVNGAAFGTLAAVALVAVTGGASIPVMLVGGLIGLEAGTLAGAAAGFFSSTDHR